MRHGRDRLKAVLGFQDGLKMLAEAALPSSLALSLPRRCIYECELGVPESSWKLWATLAAWFCGVCSGRTTERHDLMIRRSSESFWTCLRKTGRVLEQFARVSSAQLGGRVPY